VSDDQGWRRGLRLLFFRLGRALGTAMRLSARFRERTGIAFQISRTILMMSRAVSQSNQSRKSGDILATDLSVAGIKKPAFRRVADGLAAISPLRAIYS
jgi:hypothetical protein